MDNFDKNIWKIIESYMNDNPQYLVRHHIESYNDFFNNGIFQIFRDKNPMSLNTDFDEVNKLYRYQCNFYFGGKSGKHIYFGKPTINDNGNVHYMYPNEARLRDMNYSMTIHYDIEIEYIKYNDETEIGEEEEEEEPDDDLIDDEIEKEEKHLQKEKTREEKYQKLTGKTKGGAPKFTTEIEEIKMIYLGKIPIMVQSDFCILSKLPKEMRYNLGECRNEQGGYFIISGKEKVMITQEKFADNILYIRESTDDHYTYSAEIRSVSENVSKPIRSLSVKIFKPTGKYTYENIVVNIPNITRPVPLFIVFRALGVLSDKEIIQYCLLDMDKYKNMVDLFIPSVHDAGTIYSQNTALFFISQLLIKNKTIEKTLEILADYFLPHVGEFNFKEKAYYLGYMVFRLLSVKIQIEPPTNRDNFKYKRMETAGSLIGDLFREYYNIQINKIHHLFEEQYYLYSKGIYEKNLRKLVNDRYETIFNENRVLESGISIAFKGNWGSQTHTKRIGIVQDLNRLSFNSAMGHLRKTNVPLDASIKLVGPRLLHNTQWGYLDAIDTPDGSHIGIHKNLSLFTCITKGISREPMIKWLREKSDMKLLSDCNIDLVSTMTKVFVNGYWTGLVKNPSETVDKIKLFKRNALIPIYISATFDIKQNTVFVYTDAGRLSRPIFYVDNGKLSADKILGDKGDIKWEQLISGMKPKSREYSSNSTEFFELEDLYQLSPNEKRDKFFEENMAVVDYIDTSETENAFISINYKNWTNKNKSEQYTHCEIHESLIFGAMFQLVIFPEHNAQQRDLFSCGQSKQAVSMYHTNYLNRMDKNGVVLNAPQIPIVKSRYLEYITGEENLYGQNTIVAIMSHTGYNVEDSILFNEGSLQRGLFRTTYYNTYQSFEEKSKVSDNLVEKIFTDVMTDGRVIKNKPGYDYSHLDEKGIIKEGTLVDDKIIMIGLTTNDLENPEKRIDNSIPCKKGQLGVVDKTFITEGEEGHRIAKVRIREERIPAIGDKMASRAGQKGTVGLIIPEKDMPFTKDGIRPDMIINPHAIPSRMTIGQLLETLLSKGAVVYGAFGDCTAFNNQEINKTKTYGEHLNKMGYHSSGNEIMYNGMSGEQIEMEVFIGPTYYMRLKHMVKDKINYRALGPNAALTRQPVSGRANDGGLRIGEMERDSMAGHGITHFLKESMMERADKYFMAVCNQTGMIAIYNPSKNLFLSPMADGPIKFTGVNDDLRLERITKFGREFSIVAIPYSMKLFIQELQAMNIQMRIITEDNIEQIENIIGEKHIPLEKIVAKNNPIAKKGGSKSHELPTITEDESFQEAETEEAEAEEAEDDTDYKNIEFIRDEEEEKSNEPDIIDSPFKLGETVHIRGDINPYRLWKIKNIGNKFVTVETDDIENIMSSDTIKVVSFLDILSMTDMPQHEQQQNQQLQQPQIQQQPMPTQQPSINIKFVNGPDHSIESPQQPIEIIPNNETMAEPVRQKQVSEEKSDDDTIDFSKNLIIHKI
jgi:DNA-directed RNA polymerase II subunit RPB2